MSLRLRSALAVWAGLSVAACGQSHQTVGGVEVSRSLQSLTDAEWEALCQWRFALRSDGELTTYWCGADNVPSTEEPSEFPKAIHYWAVNSCVFRNSAWDSCEEPCPRTVRQFADCALAEDEHQCFNLDRPPECLILYRECGGCP